MQTTLICTFYSFEPFIASATKSSPSKIIIFVAANSMKEPTVRENVEKARAIYKGVMPVPLEVVNESDVLSVASKTAEIIERESKENSVIVNISGGSKLLAQGILYGAYARRIKVSKILCNDFSSDNMMAELPKLSFGLTKAKRWLLEEISKRDGRSIEQIAKKLGKTRGMLYQHLKELKELGYVDEKFEVTLAGKLALV